MKLQDLEVSATQRETILATIRGPDETVADTSVVVN